MKKMLLLSVTLFLILVGCDSSDGGNNKSIASGKESLLFFLNPYGAPCQQQIQILEGMGSELTEKVDLVYVSTAELDKTKPMFEMYGIRGLPTLILVDSTGDVIERFPPGIQSSYSINSVIKE